MTSPDALILFAKRVEFMANKGILGGRGIPGRSSYTKPGVSAGLVVPRACAGRHRLHGLLLHDFIVGRLGSAARSLGEGSLDLLDGFGLGDALHRGDFAREPIERGFIELALRVGLLRL